MVAENTNRPKAFNVGDRVIFVAEKGSTAERYAEFTGTIKDPVSCVPSPVDFVSTIIGDDNKTYKRPSTDVRLISDVDILADIVGKRVVVFIGKGDRHSFETQISVEGTLEDNSADPDVFRVLVNDENYAYFRRDEIGVMKSYGQTLKSGAVAVIYIRPETFTK